MKLMIAMALLSLFGRSAASAEPLVGSDVAPIPFAVLAFRPKPETMVRWQPLVDYLNASNLGRRFTLEALSYPEMEAAVRARQVGIVLTQPAHYILLANRERLYSPLATLIGKEANHQLSNFGGVIVARADQPGIRDIADLRGKRIAVSDTESLGGYLMQAMELREKGIRLPEDATLVTTGVPHDKAILEVLAGRADAAFARTSVIEAMQREGKIDLTHIRVINSQDIPGFPFALSTRLYPEWALSAMPWLDDDTTRKIAVAILALPHGGQVANAARIHGFTIPGNYEPVEELMRALRVVPFDTAPSFTVKDVWLRYQAWISVFASAGFLVLLLTSIALLRSNRGLVAERAQTGNLLRQLNGSEERHRSLVTSSPDWIWEVDAEATYTYCSPKVFDILGYAPEEVLGRKPFDFMTEAEARRTREAFADHVRTRMAFSGLENVNRHKDGKEVVLETSAVPILDNQGQLIGYRGIDRDVTVRKRIEKELESYRAHLEELVTERTAELQMAETRYRTVADFTYDWETWIDADGRWLYCSPSCLRLTGHQAREFMDRPDLFLEIIHPEDRPQVAAHFANSHHDSDDIGRITFRLTQTDGTISWIEHVCQPIHGPEREYLGRRASNRDISDRKTAEIDLIKARDAAMVANVAKSAFLANMSHEMRTPLHQISGMAQLVRREPLTVRQTERMDKLDAALRHMTGMIERILELTKLEAGLFNLVEAPIVIDDVLRNVATMLRDRIEAKGLHMLMETEPMPDRLLGDAMHIQAALLNLADNAVKFTDCGSVVMWAKLVEETSTDVLLRFEVEDTGIGIATEALPSLFSTFQQADESLTRKYGGTGIGLAMVSRLAHALGGEAGCASTPGAGSTFWFTARVRKASAAN
jgi:PAS domain S-box-containing protein